MTQISPVIKTKMHKRQWFGGWSLGKRGNGLKGVKKVLKHNQASAKINHCIYPKVDDIFSYTQSNLLPDSFFFKDS